MCVKPITGGAPFQACGRDYHRPCFKCVHCEELIGPDDEWLPHENQPYCKEDYEALFCQRCAECHGAIIGEYFSLLGKTWHPAHLKCTSCKVPLVDEDGVQV